MKEFDGVTAKNYAWLNAAKFSRKDPERKREEQESLSLTGWNGARSSYVRKPRKR
jgi:hypothetical protein